MSSLGESPSPSAYREQNPHKPPPPEYKPPSMLMEHKGLALVFAAIMVGSAAYGFRVLHAAARRAPAGTAQSGPAVSHAPGASGAPAAEVANSAQPIYIETLPDK